MNSRTLKIFSVFTLIFILLLTSASCKRRKSLAELRREERQAISQFISDKNINVLRELPADTIFLNEKDYYLSSSGLYIHVVDKGAGLPPQEGERIFVRFYEMRLTIPPDTTYRAMFANEQGNADEFLFNSGGAVVIAFNEAASYMGDEGEAFLIVPSAIGSVRAQQNITPYYYHIRIQIQ